MMNFRCANIPTAEATGNAASSKILMGFAQRFYVHELASALVWGERRFSVVCGAAADCGSVLQNRLTAAEAQLLAHALNEIADTLRARLGLQGAETEVQLELRLARWDFPGGTTEDGASGEPVLHMPSVAGLKGQGTRATIAPAAAVEERRSGAATRLGRKAT